MEINFVTLQMNKLNKNVLYCPEVIGYLNTENELLNLPSFYITNTNYNERENYMFILKKSLVTPILESNDSEPRRTTAVTSNPEGTTQPTIQSEELKQKVHILYVALSSTYKSCKDSVVDFLLHCCKD